MPCMGYESSSDYNSRLNSELRNTERERDRVSNLLCGVLRSLKEETVAKLCKRNPDLGNWWVDHQEEDRKREMHERREARLERKRLLRRKRAIIKEAEELGLKLVPTDTEE